MKRFFPIWMAILGLIGAATLIMKLQEWSNPGIALPGRVNVAKPTQVPTETLPDEPPKVPIPRAPIVAAVQPAAVAAPVTGEGLVPGHFAGITVQHQPLADQPPKNEPEAGVAAEVTTRSGKKLLRVHTGERDAIPLRPTPAK